MGDLPPLTSLAGMPPRALYGLITDYAAPALTASYEFSWQRDRALHEAIRDALGAAAGGTRGGEASKPRWLDGLVARELRGASIISRSSERFVRVRLLERLHLIDLEPDDTYVLAMISSLGSEKAEKLRADPELVERALWRVFEVEGGGEVSMTNVDRFGRDEWQRTFLELAADGTLDRGRVLAECLRTLNRDFAAYRASWFSATYLALEPTEDEVVAAQPDLRRLLNASIPPTVAFALKLLIRVHKSGRIDAEETLDALPPATLVKAKGTALSALRLARALSTGHQSAAAKVAQTALGHPHADVQLAAASLLADCGASEGVSAAQEDLAPSVRKELGFPVRAPGPAVERPLQRLAPQAEPVDATDAAERTAALLEDASHAIELEAVLAALSRPEVADSLTPLRKRAKAVVERGSQSDFGDAWLPGQIARLVLGILGDAVPPSDPAPAAQRFVVRRIHEVRQSSAPLLATPDLPGGWVSPSAMLERLAQTPAPRHHDLIAALLRLHPDGRAEIPLDGIDLPAAARFAFDGEAPTTRQGPPAWWIAAERSRAPYAAQHLPLVTGEVKVHTWKGWEDGLEHRTWYARFEIATSMGRRSTFGSRPADDQPTELVAGASERRGYIGDWIPSLAAIWPQDAEHFLALTCESVLESPSGAEVNHDVPRILDALAQHPGRMGSLAVATLAAGLSAARREDRLHAIDAFVDLVPSGRVPLPEVATTLASYAQAWPANRWAECLVSASLAPGVAETVVDLLTQLLPQLQSSHRGLNKLLEVLHDQTVQLGHSVADTALLAWLAEIKGSSAAARTARRLLG